VWDVRWPSSDRENRIVYELDGELQVMDVKSGKSTAAPITVPDDGINRRAGRVAAGALIEDFDLSPKGERALFSARGDIFTAPVEHGPTRNLSHSPAAHDKAAAWSPDGAKIAYLSDASGEEEVWTVAQDGSTAPEQITSGGQAMRYRLDWSPDGKRIAFSDKDGKLYYVTLADKKVTEVAHCTEGNINDYAWSPGSDYLSFSINNAQGLSPLYIYSVPAAELHKVTEGLFDEGAPAWDPKGDYLYYLARHEFHPQISRLEFDFAGNRMSGIFALALRKDVKNPFPVESDEVTIKKDEPKKDEAKKDEPKKDEAKKDAPKQDPPH